MCVTLLEREDFKLPLGGLDNMFSQTVQKSLKILQLALSWQNQDYNVVAKVLEEAMK